ncbi:protein YgfX [uncultured Shewanella sp.]|uniref:protein YgfX n=1 Tax=uncultured Shewanella sp. TaxID=173975 RepID=UPI002620814D|nr:protein YgfX [uncultured Shewanella sp.]
MAEQPHSFSLTASFDQRLSLVVFGAVSLTSFLAWPDIDNLYYLLIKGLCLSLLFLFLSYQLWSLNHWRCKFSLDVRGEGRLDNRRGDESVKFKLAGRRVVTPFASLFYLQTDRDKRLLIVWADMLDDTSYRHLCRLLLAQKR